MTERPILMSAPMVRACLREVDPKTQTRRVVQQQPPRSVVNVYAPFAAEPNNWQGIARDDLISWYGRCPYGQAGDRLWVRESFARSDFGKNGYLYRADGDLAVVSWSPSIHMPRAACRLVLEVTGVRVERLQAISDADAKAEGMVLDPAIACYRALWDDLNAKRGFGWSTNPWVWVVSFKGVRA